MADAPSIKNLRGREPLMVAVLVALAAILVAVAVFAFEKQRYENQRPFGERFPSGTLFIDDYHFSRALEALNDSNEIFVLSRSELLSLPNSYKVTGSDGLILADSTAEHFAVLPVTLSDTGVRADIEEVAPEEFKVELYRCGRNGDASLQVIVESTYLLPVADRSSDVTVEFVHTGKIKNC